MLHCAVIHDVLMRLNGYSVLGLVAKLKALGILRDSHWTNVTHTHTHTHHTYTHIHAHHTHTHHTHTDTHTHRHTHTYTHRHTHTHIHIHTHTPHTHTHTHTHHTHIHTHTHTHAHTYTRGTITYFNINDAQGGGVLPTEQIGLEVRSNVPRLQVIGL